jgi:TonB family protein
VRLELLVDALGAVQSVQLVEGLHAELDAAAVAAAKNLVFEPAALNGQPVSVRLRYAYEFQKTPTASGTLRGEVRARGTREPVPGAAILDESRKLLATTDGSGKFELSLEAGAHPLSVEAPGFRPATFSEHLTSGQELSVVYRLERVTIAPYETVVRGDPLRTEASRVTLTEQELREVPGTLGDPFRVVMLLPGVSSVASGFSYPVVRGAQPAATGYFLDGVRVPGLFHLLVGSAVVHPDFIDRIDFFPGVAPPQYGRSLGGVVDAQVSRPRENGLHASAYADILNAGLFVEYPFTSTGTEVTLGARASYTGLIVSKLASALMPADPDGYRQRLVADLYDYQARIEQRVGEGRLRLLAFGSSDFFGTAAENPDMVGMLLSSRFHRVDLRYRRGLLGGEAELAANWGTEAAGIDGSRAGKPYWGYLLESNSLTARTSWRREAGVWTFAAGGDVENRRAATRVTYELPRADGLPNAETAVFEAPTTLATFAGAWANVAWAPSAQFSVSAGLRLDNYHLVPGLDFLAVDPRLTARYRLSDEVTLRASAGMVHQPPTTLLSVPVLDIAGLRYGLQEAAQVDAAVEWRPRPGVEVSLQGYYAALTRAVEFDLMSVLEGQRLSVPGEALGVRGRSMGLELMVRKALGGNWFGWVSYSLQSSVRHQRFARLDAAYNVVEVVEADLPFAFDQTHVLNAALSYHLPKNWTVGAVFHFNTGRPESGQVSSRTQTEGVDPQTGLPVWHVVNRDELQRLPSFYRVDVRVSKLWAYEDFTLEAYLDVLNATVNQEVLGYYYLPLGVSELGLEKQPFTLPIAVPMLGLKGTY